MGMDVYGKNPVSENGKYFRNNVWWWRPLWEYCLKVAPKVAGKVKYGHSNDGDGLGAIDAIRLADALQAEVDSGRAAEYERLYTAHLESLECEECDICNGTGKRAEPPKVGAGSMPCNGCEASGKVKPWAASYPFSEENVKGFIAFLRECGGFEIC